MKKLFIASSLESLRLSLITAIPGIYDKTRPVVQDGYVDTSAMNLLVTIQKR